MNKQLYFVFGFLSAILFVSMFASVSAIGWREIFGVEKGQADAEGDGEVQLAPMPGGSPYSCSANTDTKTRTLQACQWVRSPLGEFTDLNVDNVAKTGMVISRTVKANERIWVGDSLLFSSASIAGPSGQFNDLYIGDMNGPTQILQVFQAGEGSLQLKARDPFTGSLRPSTFEVDTLKANSIDSPPLSGTGNAYVCVDQYGHFFRSLTPCR